MKNTSVRDLAKKGAGLLLSGSWVAAASRSVLWRERCGILLYHDPNPDLLDRHLTHLKKSYKFITLAELYACLADPEVPWPGRCLVLTFDDGRVGNFHLKDIFIKHQVRPTIYICSAIVGTARTFWWLHPSAKELGRDFLKSLPNSERLAKQRISGFDPEDQGDRRQALSLDEVHSLQEVADIQAHTRFHPILTQCDDEECWAEIAGSLHDVEQMTGLPCTDFAYPNGNYDSRVAAFVRKAGFRSARTTDIGWNDRHTDKYRLRAIGIPDNASIEWLDANLTGIPRYFDYLRQGSFSGRAPQYE